MRDTSVGRAHRRRARNSVDVALDAFALLVHGPRPPSLDGAQFDGLPDRQLPLDEVRDLFLSRRCPQQTSDAVWACLVRRSRTDGTAWTVAAVGVALPALTSVTALLSRSCPGDAVDVPAEVLRGFLDAMPSVDLDRPRIVLRLRWAAYRAGRRVVIRTLADRTHEA